MIQVNLFILGILVVSAWASPSIESRREIYLETCESSCGVVTDAEEADECRDKFCPNYVNYLLTGVTDANAKPTLASTNHKEVAEFCATWIVRLIENIGWQNRIPMNLNKCMCAAGKDCLVK